MRRTQAELQGCDATAGQLEEDSSSKHENCMLSFGQRTRVKPETGRRHGQPQYLWVLLGVCICACVCMCERVCVYMYERVSQREREGVERK
eukprot:549012-Pleurochrysis_carterae.AAC.2